jgi:hypothetical protein
MSRKSQGRNRRRRGQEYRRREPGFQAHKTRAAPSGREDNGNFYGNRPEKPSIEVPKLGEQLLHFFVSREISESKIGDLSEDYRKRYPKLGPRGACVWYYKETALLLLKEVSRLTKLFSFLVEDFVRKYFA